MDDSLKGAEKMDHETDPAADEGGVLIEKEADDQESNEPTDTDKSMASEIPKENVKENTQRSFLQNQEEPEKEQVNEESARESRSSLQNEEKPRKPQVNEESEKESLPKKQVPINVITSWSDWVARASTNVSSNKEVKGDTSTSQSRVKRKRDKEPKGRSVRIRRSDPFKMTESQKRKEPDNEDNPCGQHQSMAQKVCQWQRKTPERLRVKPAEEQNQGPPASLEKTSLKPTAPKTSDLKSKDRKRPLLTDCLSKEEQEKQQEAEIKKEPKKPRTEIEPFKFNTDQRANLHKTKEPPGNEEQIKAKPRSATTCRRGTPFNYEKSKSFQIVRSNSFFKATSKKQATLPAG